MKYYITDENIIVKYKGISQTWTRPFRKYYLFTIVGNVEEPLFNRRYYAIPINIFKNRYKVRKLTLKELILYFISGKVPKF